MIACRLLRHTLYALDNCRLLLLRTGGRRGTGRGGDETRRLIRIRNRPSVSRLFIFFFSKNLRARPHKILVLFRRRRLFAVGFYRFFVRSSRRDRITTIYFGRALPLRSVGIGDRLRTVLPSVVRQKKKYRKTKRFGRCAIRTTNLFRVLSNDYHQRIFCFFFLVFKTLIAYRVELQSIMKDFRNLQKLTYSTSKNLCFLPGRVLTVFRSFVST